MANKHEKMNALVAQAEELIKNGTRMKDACKQLGISPMNVYNRRKTTNKKNLSTETVKTPRQSQMLSIPIPDDDQVVIIMGKASVIQSALEKVKR